MTMPVEWEYMEKVAMEKEAAKMDWRRAKKPGSYVGNFGEKMSIKKITDKLLAGEITNEEAQKLLAAANK